MNNIEIRKAQLREYIEARAKSTQGHMTLYRRDHDHGYISYDVEDESMTAFTTTLLDCDQPKAKQNAEFTVLAANESTLIAEQLLECIEALEKIADYSTCEELHPGCKKYKSYEDGWHGVAEYAKQTLNKIAGEK